MERATLLPTLVLSGLLQALTAYGAGLLLQADERPGGSLIECRGTRAGQAGGDFARLVIHNPGPRSVSLELRAQGAGLGRPVDLAAISLAAGESAELVVGDPTRGAMILASGQLRVVGLSMLHGDRSGRGENRDVECTEVGGLDPAGTGEGEDPLPRLQARPRPE